MNLLDIRLQTWSILETDDEEFPTSLIDAFAVDGFNSVVGTERRWPTWQTSADVTVPASTGSVAVGGGAFSSAMREVTSLIDVTNRTALFHRPFRDAVEVYGADEGVPEAWSVWGGELYLWPVPATTVTLKAVGYRAPLVWWSDPSAEIDCDVLFHMPILYFVLSRCFARMEDTEMSRFYEQMFATGVATTVQQVLARNTSDEAVVLHGGGRRTYLDRPNLTNGF
jgi:hypothetical protein